MKNNRQALTGIRFLMKAVFIGVMIWVIQGEVLFLKAETVSAADMSVYEGVTVSPNGQAWTTDYLDKTGEQLPAGFMIDTGIASSLPALKQGEHYYRKAATGSVKVGKWIVVWPNAQCIHYYGSMDYMGYHLEEGICGNYYNNGWNAYCADCGDYITNLHIYAKSSTIRGITSMPARSVYMYICPFCHGLEQGADYQHFCKAVSANRYKVSYEANASDGMDVTGYMPDTGHMYDNVAIYEGKNALELGYGDRALRRNSYSCVGYVFTGWNTRADGSGEAFLDGQQILNLSDREGDTVRLYAQWKKTESTLVVDADGGSYQGQPTYVVTGGYLTEYHLQESLLVPGAGYKVQFEVFGGSDVADIQTKRSFAFWEAQGSLFGTLNGDKYVFGMTDQAVDRVRAVYYNEPFVLPNATKTNASLVGWYTDAGLGEHSFVGKPGDEISVSMDTVLYAKWATLTLWAHDDYGSHGGTGAVDLCWEQKDGNSKYYRVYQSRDAVNWTEIYKADSVGSTVTVSQTFDTAARGSVYTVETTGYYTLTAMGAKGADYNSSYIGGYGGCVTADYWLQKGDLLTFYAGTAGSGLQGGSNLNSAAGGSALAATGRGGGAGTEIYLTRSGTRTALLIAGGGGGANEKTSGKAGGQALSNIGSMRGGNASYGGGGGGATGGSGGTYSVHNHTGSATSGGGCYEAKSGTKVCGTAYEVHGGYWECACGETWGTASDSYFSELHAGCGATYWMDPLYLCSGCQKQLSDGETHRIGYTYYALGCIYKDKPNGYVISASASYGGTNYINTGYGCKNQTSQSGKNNGAGYGRLQSIDIGYREETTLQDVTAKDCAAPAGITDYGLSLSAQSQIKITITRPVDYGTVYYHLTKSFSNSGGGIRYIADSNVTRNVLTTGVAGYYYYTDQKETGSVTESCSRLTGEVLTVNIETANTYLHIAAVDKAGNIGPVSHILLSLEDLPADDSYPESVSIRTKKLFIEDTEFVYSEDGENYYVKADGSAEHKLCGTGYLDGAATADYQIDRFQLQMNGAAGTGWFEVVVPHADIAVSSKDYSGDSLTFFAGGNAIRYIQPAWTEAARQEHGSKLMVNQVFTVSENESPIHIYPRAMAALRGKEYYSPEEQDQANGLTVIPDGTAPEIRGLEALQEFDILDMSQQMISFTVSSADTGSGLEEFKVIVSNKDNFLEKEFDAVISSQGVGEITITIEKENPLFLGEICISAMAADHVGNVNLVGEDSITFTLEPEPPRQREPHGQMFKAGDGAVLEVTTTGYADRVEIIFPEAFTALWPELDQVYEYPYPYLRKTEQIDFCVPLDTLQNSYEITVIAWKNGQMLTQKPVLLVVEGSVLDELRTRIRSNG